MFRLSNLLKSTLEDLPQRSLNGAICIWNFTNRCNLNCLHCYSKASLDQKEIVDQETIFKTIDDFKKNNIKFIIFSGGEPLVRKDIFDIAKKAKEEGIITYLSTNGLYINKTNSKKILDHFDYIGISIDGDEKTHDFFRGLAGSYQKSLEAINLLNSFKKTKVGLRFTITKDTLKDLPFIFDLVLKNNIPKLYISHLVYSGRGLENLKMDISKEQRKEAVEFIINKAFEFYEKGIDIDIVTGNMEMDAILFLEKFSKKYPDKKEDLLKRLKKWGGNSAARNLLNINYKGEVKPDPFFPISLGNIQEDSFDNIWNQNNELLKKLREFPRKLEGKCKECEFLEICNGGSRSRAYAIYGDLWQEDPSCYI